MFGIERYNVGAGHMKDGFWQQGVVIDHDVLDDLKAQGFTVKRLAFGFNKVEAASEAVRSIANMTHIGRSSYNRISDTNVWQSDDGGLLMVDFYDASAPSELYVVVKNEKAYTVLKQDAGL